MVEPEIDLFRDGALETAKKLRLRALGGRTVEGGFDLPSTSGISKIGKESSNLHVDFNQPISKEVLSDDVYWSYHSNEAPPTLQKEPVASDTRSPFIYPEGTKEAPGLFGKALRAYSEARAIMEMNYQDSSFYTDAFSDVWGLNDDQKSLLDKIVPIPQSSGAAMWGGVGRKLQPTCFAYGPGQASLKVTFHNAERKSFGEDAIVDWARVGAITRAVASQVGLDDELGVSKVKRLDYAIDPRKVPQAPKTVVIKPFKVFEEENKFHHDYTSPGFTYYEKARAIKVIHEKDEEFETLKFEDVNSIPSLDPVLIQNNEVKDKIDWTNIFSHVDSSPFLEKKHVSKLKEPLKELDMSHVLRELIKSNMRKHQQGIPRHIHYKKMKVEFFENKDSIEHKRAMVNLVQLAVPDNILHMIHTLGNVVSPGMGQIWFRRVKDKWDIPNSVFQKVDLRAVKMAFCRLERCLERILYDLDVCIYEIEHEYIRDLSRFELKTMLNSGSVVEGLEFFFTKHKIYWSRRYENAAKSILIRDKGEVSFELIRNQCLTVVFKNAKFIVRRDGSVDIDYKRLAESMNQTAFNYLRKRKKLQFEHDHFGGFSYMEIQNGTIDSFLSEKVGEVVNFEFKRLLPLVERSLSDFSNDVKMMLQKLTQYGSVPEPDELEDVPDEPLEAANIQEIPDQHDVGNEGNMFDDDFDDDEVLEVDDTVDLEEELISDFQILEPQDRQKLLNEFGDRVSMEIYSQVKDRVKELLSTKVASGSGEILDPEDIV